MCVGLKEYVAVKNKNKNKIRDNIKGRRTVKCSKYNILILVTLRIICDNKVIRQ